MAAKKTSKKKNTSKGNYIGKNKIQYLDFKKHNSTILLFGEWHIMGAI